MEQSNRAFSVNQKLIEHYGYPKRRNPLPPVDQLVSTILSQNTNDTNRDRAFKALRDQFPTWEAVRDANPEEIIDAIRTAGLANQKGPRIQNALREITEAREEITLDFLSQMPPEEARQWLMQFKGVGPKTAAIVMLFSLGIPAFPVDTHVFRVTGRLGIRPQKLNADQSHDHLAQLLPPEEYYPAHLNLIRLGREICQARKPKCLQCPLQDLCDYFTENYSDTLSEL